MPRPLWPTEFVRLPIEMLTYRDPQGKRLPANILETWLDFRALAWGRTETPELEFDRLRRETGKSRSTLCGHLAILTHCFSLRWLISGNCVQVFFEGSPAQAPVQKAGRVQEPGLATHANLPGKPGDSRESRKLDLPPLESLNQMNPQIKDSRVQKAGRVQKSGLAQPASPSMTLQITDAYVAELGYDPGAWAEGEGKAAKWIGEHYTVEQFVEAYRHYKAQSYWADKRLTLRYLKLNISDYFEHKAHGSHLTNSNRPDTAQLQRDQQFRAQRDARRQR